NVIDRPVGKGYSVADVVDGMKQFDGQCIVQTMMLRGEHDGKTIDNTTDEEIEALIMAYKDINPREVMLYSIDRKTPAEHLVKVEREELEDIAERFRREGIRVAVS
ncbi:MAG: radical SAM protein, partial [Muribaculaceae bacterium]|nr:radical SAM protein [Muribaculaceae bacterium]